MQQRLFVNVSKKRLFFFTKNASSSNHWNFLCFAQRLHCNSLVSLLSIQSKTWSSFLSALLNWRKNSNFFKLAVLRSDSMKRNYEGLIFNLPLALAVLTRTHASHLNSYSISSSLAYRKRELSVWRPEDRSGGVWQYTLWHKLAPFLPNNWDHCV